MRRSTPSPSGDALMVPVARAASPSTATLQTAPVAWKSPAAGSSVPVCRTTGATGRSTQRPGTSRVAPRPGPKVSATPATTRAWRIAAASAASVEVGPPGVVLAAPSRSGSGNRMSKAIAAAPASCRAVTRRAMTSRGHGHWPYASRLRSSTATMATRADGAGRAVWRTNASWAARSRSASGSGWTTASVSAASAAASAGTA